MKRKYLRNGVMIMAMFALLISCGSSGGGSGDDVKTAAIALSVSPTVIPADGISSATVTASLTDNSGTAVPEETSVTFSTTLGSFPNGSHTYNVKTPDDSGTVTVSLIAATIIGNADVVAESSDVTQKAALEFIDASLIPRKISLSTSQISVKSDNSDSATITATVLDAYNAVVEGITVAFSATGGQLGAASADTDANGQAVVTFSSGSAGPSNQVVTITATVTDLEPAQIPIQVLGSTLTLATDKTQVSSDGLVSAILTATAKDAGGTEVYNAPITFSVPETGGGSVKLSSFEVRTGVTGEAKVTVTGTRAGSVTVFAEGLGETASQEYRVTPPGTDFFHISEPTDDPANLSIGEDLAITVTAPAPTTSVVFVATFGAWDGGSSSVVTQTVGNGSVSAVFSSPLAGVASIQVYDEDNPSDADSMEIVVSAAIPDAAHISLQSNSYVVPLSSGGNSYSATLTASVRTSFASGRQPVGGASVAFSLDNQTGGGETIFPAIVFTDDSGVATTTFTSGSLSSGAEGVEISATVLGQGATGSLTTIAFNDTNADTITRSDAGSFVTDGFQAGEQIRVEGSANNDGDYTIASVSGKTLTLDSNDSLTAEAAGSTVTITAVTSSINIVVGGTSGSIVIGRGSKIEILSPTTYSLPMSVLVADSNGNPQSGAVVSLSAWPTFYSTGGWLPRVEESTDQDTNITTQKVLDICDGYITGTYPNEDANENLFLDPGEDTGADPGHGDGQLTPPNSAAGNIPMTVTTEANGVANFELVYMKSSAMWIVDRIRASTVVLGTETTSSMSFRLPYEKSEAEGCELPNSPYNPTAGSLAVDKITLTALPNNMTADGSSTSTIFAEVTDVKGNPVDGEVITFELTAGTGTLSAQKATTSGGVATVTYTASDTPGTVTITASADNGVTASVDITLIEAIVGSVSVTAGSDSVVANGTSQVLIMATVVDQNGKNVADGTAVSFTTTAGGLSNISSTINGVATATLTSSISVGTATIEATAGGVIGRTTVDFIPGPVRNIQLTATPMNLTADGSSTSDIRALVTDKNGNVVNGETVSFAIISGSGELDAAIKTTDGGGGVAEVTYTASRTIGTETVRARTTNGVSATVNITLIGPVIKEVDCQVGCESGVTGDTPTPAPGPTPCPPEDPVLVHAFVLDINGNPVLDGTPVTFTTTLGTFQGAPAPGTIIVEYTDNGNGEVTAMLVPSTRVGTANIAVWAGGVCCKKTVEFIAGPAATISLTATPSTLVADGTSKSVIRAYVTDEYGNPIDGETVSFSPASLGLLSDATAETNNGGGAAIVTYTAGTTAGTDTITAWTSNGHSDSVDIALVPEETTGFISLTADPTSIVADGVSTSVLTATLTAAGGDPMVGVPVAFYSGPAAFSPDLPPNNTYKGTTEESKDPFHSNGGSTTFTFFHDGSSAFAVDLCEYGTTDCLDLFNAPGVVNGSTVETNLDAGDYYLDVGKASGEWSIKIEGDIERVRIQPSGDTLLAMVDTDTNGDAETTYTSTTQTGLVPITAVSGELKAEVEIEQIPGSPENLDLWSNSRIAANGVSYSTITAEVTDAYYNPVPGAAVNFSATAGTISPTTELTDTRGRAGALLTSIYSNVLVTSTVTATVDGLTESITDEFVPVTLRLRATETTGKKANGTDSYTITAQIQEASSNQPMSDTIVTFSYSGNDGIVTVEPVATETDDNGIATCKVMDISSIDDPVIISATSGAVASVGMIGLVFTGTGGGGTPVGSVKVAATETTGKKANGVDSYTVTAQVLDAVGQPIEGAGVTFSASGNSGLVAMNPPVATTAQDGTATCEVTDISDISDTVDISASSGGVNSANSITLHFAVPAGPGVPASLGLATSQISVKSDNSDSATITATVLDGDNAVVEGITVEFSADGGQLSTSKAQTDANGEARVEFSSGTVDQSNRVVTVTARVSGLPDSQIPIQVVGSTLTLTTDNNVVTSDGITTATLTILAKDAAGTPVYNTPITLTSTGSGTVTISPSSGNTDILGKLEVTVTGTSAGDVTVTAEGLGTTATQDYEVILAGAVFFRIIQPQSDPVTWNTLDSGPVAITGPSTQIAFADADPDTITRSDGGDFTVDGFSDGDRIMVGGSSSNDTDTGIGTPSYYTIDTVTPNTLTLVATDQLTTEAAGASVVIANSILVRVEAPPPTASVKFATTFGTWDGGASPVVTKNVVGGSVWAVFSSSQAGVATIHVTADDDPTSFDSLEAVISAPSADAAHITLQSNTYVVPLSLGNASNTATLTASVRTSSATGRQPVGGAAVAFSIQNQTGGGETVFPVIVYTDASGIATTTFTSGSLSSGSEGVTITATVLGQGSTGPLTTISFNDTDPDTITRSDGGSFMTDGYQAGEQIRVQGSGQNDGWYIIDSVAADTITLEAGDTLTDEPEGSAVTITAVTASTNIVVGGTAGSLVIGRGSEITVLSPTTYSLPMSVLVADSNGNPVPGTTVSLNAWPIQYSTGEWVEVIILTDQYCEAKITGTYPNEDVNENLFLDPGEDTGNDPGHGDGELTPPNSAAGTVPMTVTTDANGVANFDLVYMKSSAMWIVDRIQASTLVLGTETTSSMTFRLPAEKTEAWLCELPDSPYNQELPVNHINLTATPSNLTADGSSTSIIRAEVFNEKGLAVEGEVVSFDLAAGTGTLSVPTATTDDQGVAEIIYTVSTTSGIATITATTDNGTTATVNIELIEALVGSITCEVGCDEIGVGGGTAIQVSATVLDKNGKNVLDGTPVTFTTTAGEFQDPDDPLTPTIKTVNTFKGVAAANLFSPDNVGTATIKIIAGGVCCETSVAFVPGPAAVLSLRATPNNLTADGWSQSTIRALLTDANGNAITGETISFSVSTTGTSSGELSSYTATTSEGIATVTYTASTESGEIDTIRAEATDSSVFGTADITLIDVVVGMVSVSAGSGTAVADGSSQTLITAAVQDTKNNNVADGTMVTFTTSAGDIDNVTPGNQTTFNAPTTNGVAKAWLVSPTNVGTAAVIATVGGVLDSATVTFISGSPDTIQCTATPNNLTADGWSESTIRALVTDANGNVVSGETISFSVTTTGTIPGELSPYTAVATDGIATVTYTASREAGVTDTIRAEATDSTIFGTVDITLVDVVVGTVSVSAGSDTAIADGSTRTLISATVQDNLGNNVADGTTVTFTTMAGTFEDPDDPLTPTTKTADTTNGVATAWLISATNVGRTIITATVGGVTDSTEVNFIAGAVGNISLAAVPNNLTADGASESTIRATVTDADGNAVADGEVISFSLSTITGSLSAPTATTEGGIATVTYTAATTSGTETITAVSTNGTTATVDITLIEATIGSVSVSAGTEYIIANETSQSLIMATVLDTLGNPVVDGTTVTFTTTAGTFDDPDDPLIPTIKTADTTNGVASVYLISAANVGVGTVTATVGGVADTTEVYFIAGAVDAISLVAVPNNLTADGASQSTIRATVTDADGNAVADGELISFSLIPGSTGSLSAPTATTEGGVATVTYTVPLTAGTETVTAVSTNGTTETVDITLIGATIGSVSVSAGTDEIVADGTSWSLITATVLDTLGNPVADGTTVTFTTTAGTLSNITTTSLGVAYAELTSATNVGVAKVTATAGGVADSAGVSFIAGAVGNINLFASPNNLTADGSSESTIRATVTDASGNAVADGEVISFSVTTGTGTLNVPTASTEGGVATVTYTASLTAGTETVTAVSTNGVTETVNITLIGATVGSLSVSTGTEEIVADGTSQSLITASVLDTLGNKVADGTLVTFTTSAGEFLGADPLTPTTIDVATTYGLATASLISATNVGTAFVSATSGGQGDNTTVTFIPGPVYNISLTALPNNLPADGTSTSDIRAYVIDRYDNAVEGEVITFSATCVSGSCGTLSAPTATTEGGVATLTYTASSAGGNETVTAEATNGVSDSVNISLTGLQIASIELSASPSSLPADGVSWATINATVSAVGGGQAPDLTPVNFEIIDGGGSFSGSSTYTASTVAGVASAFLTSATTVGTATIRAEAQGRTAEIEIDYTPGSLTLTIIPNSLLGTGEESAEVTATLEDEFGSPASGETVHFTLDDLSLGTITPSAISNVNGEAEALFLESGRGGTVTVTGTWSTSGVEVTGSATIDIQAPPAFIENAEGSPVPASINIKGTGGQSTSLITFDVKDSSGNLVADGYRIDFSLDSGPNGGENIVPLSARTAGGQVSTILYSGFKSGPVAIKATYHHDRSISTTTSQIAINGGPPVGEEFGIFAEYVNISGYWMANLQDNISINAGDIYGNAIPDETAISFKTYNTGGFFTPNTATTIEGLATNVLHSAGSYLQPLQGFLSVTGEAINGGRTTHVTSLVVNPLSSNILYAGTDGGGVYKSIDSGATWVNISRSSENEKQGQNWIDPHVKGNSAICVDPDDPNRIYVGTGYLGRGHVYRSLDGGMNWNSNNVEEWNGILDTDEAILTVLCDGGGSDYVWAGTEGLGAILATDGETFQWGGVVTPPTDPGAANTGTGTMSQPTLSASSQTETWTATYEKTGATPSMPAFTDVSGAGADGTMSSISATETAETGTWTMTYTGGYDAVTGVTGTGTAQGTLTVVATSASTLSETWTVRCIVGTDGSEEFSVTGSVSGIHDTANLTENYDCSEVTFYIIQTGDFIGGEVFNFDTDQDAWDVEFDDGINPPVSHDAARTGVAYTSDNGEVSFTINSGANRFYQRTDEWTFDTTITGDWEVFGTVSGTQFNRARNNVAYTSDNYEVSFLISEGATPFDPGDDFTFDVTESGLGYGKVVRDMVKVPGTHGATAELYAGTNTGVFTSTDGGVLWNPTTPFTGDFITTLAVHPTIAGVVYAGTEDNGVWVSVDSGTTWVQYTTGMGEGLSATPPMADPNNVGSGVISAVTVSGTTPSEYWSATCNQAASATAPAPGANTGDGTMTAVTVDPTNTVTENWTVACNQAASATAPAPGANTGDGTMSAVTVDPGHALTEDWTVTCTDTAPDGGTFSVEGTISGEQYATASVGTEYRSDGDEVRFTISDGSIDFQVGDSFTFSTTGPTTFSVSGTVSGPQPNVTIGWAYTSTTGGVSFTISDGSTDFEVGDIFTFSTTGPTTFSVTGSVSGPQADATVGVPYTSGLGQVSFTISDGNIDFIMGDSFTFSTTRDPGQTITDLQVVTDDDPADNDQLYAITYFWGPLEPHAVGNVYVHPLDDATGDMEAAGSWTEANTSLLPAYDPPDDMALFAQHVMALDDSVSPSSLYIGGEGINLYKATSGLFSGAPAWQESKSGLTNLIMARMPILFTGPCTMSISTDTEGSTVTFTVYIEDENGNPPVEGSVFFAEYAPESGDDVVLANVTYPDCYVHQGTFRDPGDPSTNDPYVFIVTVFPGDKVTFTFTPWCTDGAPGCSGAIQERTFQY
ncbi:MAG: invasin domain 3-containing protein [Thermodesulfobacteriota bacterium]|nr:invasin domain 3-containing protein [Thermodesulfobacteriota bacterium]